MAAETPRVLIIGAMNAEVMALRQLMSIEAEGRNAGFLWWAGDLQGRAVVLARGGMGKVAAAACTQSLLDRWNITSVICIGVAGGLDNSLRPGDIVVADLLMQHDVDASPIFPRFQLPGLNLDTLMPPEEFVEAGVAAAREFLAANPLDEAVLAQNGITVPKVVQGLVVTGDQFIEDRERSVIKTVLPDAICVEMEGGAIAQVCYLNETPCCVIRIMSDNADASAAFDFLRFVEEVTPVYVSGIVTRLLPRLP